MTWDITKYSDGWHDLQCPDCYPIDEHGKRKSFSESCGLDKAEHKRMRRLRAEAERQAHRLVVQARADQALPKAIIKAAYDEARRRQR